MRPTPLPAALALAWLLLVSGRLCAALEVDAEGVAAVRSGEDLAAAFLDERVHEAVIQERVLHLKDSDWPDSPIALHRNMTVRGPSPDNGTWPLVDFGFVNSKVVLSPGVVFNFSYIVMSNYTRSLAASFDMLRGVINPLTAPSIVFMWQAAAVQPSCVPVSASPDDSLPSAIAQRPPRIPGVQRQSRVDNPPCSNTTDTPWLRRCWGSIITLEDLAAPGMYRNAFGTPQEGGYILHALRSYSLCEWLMPTACVLAYGPTGCAQQRFGAAGGGAAPTGGPGQPPLLAPPLVGGGSGGGAAAAAAEGSSGGGGGGGVSRKAMVGGVWGGVLGGVALIALAAAVVYGMRRWRRRRRHHRDKLAAAGDGSSSSSTAGSAGVCYGASRVRIKLQPGAGTAAAAAGGKGAPRDGRSAHADTYSSRGQAVAPRGPSARRTRLKNEPEHVPVTPLTPLHPGLRLDVQLLLGNGTGTTGTGTGTTGTPYGSGRGGGGVHALGHSPCSGVTTAAGSTAAGSTAAGSSELDGARVQLLPVTLGKGGYGKVVKGLYCGKPVAVKMLNTGLHCGSDSAAGGSGYGDVLCGGGGGGGKSEQGAAAPPAAPEEGHAEQQGPSPSPLQPPEGQRTDRGQEQARAPCGTAGDGGQQGPSHPPAQDEQQQQRQQQGQQGQQEGCPQQRRSADGSTLQPADDVAAAAAAAAQQQQQQHRPQPHALLGTPQQHQPPDTMYGIQHYRMEEGGDLTASGWAAAATPGSGVSGGSSVVSGPARSLLQEVEVLARVQHPNIVRLLAANLSPQRLCLVMELMDTNLERLLYGTPGRQLLPLPTVLHIGMQVARALAYLHPTILHRDLKPANILISNPHSPQPVVKLADFGISRLRTTVMQTANPEAGTAPYLAPEAFELDNHTITDKLDIYALGVLLWEMLAGMPPWAEMHSVVAIAFAVAVCKRRPPLDRMPDERCPLKLRALVQACWEHQPARRPAAAEALKSLALVVEACEMAAMEAE